jgi:hypothetical protein
MCYTRGTFDEIIPPIDQLNKVAARSKAWVCGRSPAEIVGSNPTGDTDVCRECCVCCQVEVFETS